MIRFKNCPKCAGDMFPECDIHGNYEVCLQCSFTRHLSSQRHDKASSEGKAGLEKTLQGAAPK